MKATKWNHHCAFSYLFSSFKYFTHELEDSSLMEMDKKEKQAEINPLLFKLSIPIALSIVGVIISTLRNSRTRRKPSAEQMDYYPESMTRHEFDDDESEEEEEEEEYKEADEEEEEPSTSINLLESAREISIQKCHESSNSEEHIEAVKNLVASIEDRQSALEAQFYDYCNMKEHESAFQKLQIMCLGLKLESLESQNQRIEDTISECRGVIEQVDQIRGEIKSLQRNSKKLTREYNEYSHHMQMIEEMAKSNNEFHLATREIKQVADRMHKEIKEIGLKLEISASKIEEGLGEDARRLESKKLSEHLRQLQDQWCADMEELIYVGWINASLRREILIIQEEEEAKPEVKSKDKVVMEIPDDENVKNCGIEFYNVKCPSRSADIEDLCTDIEAKRCRRGSKKPRLMQKIKVWAKGEGRYKRASESWPSANSYV